MNICWKLFKRRWKLLLLLGRYVLYEFKKYLGFKNESDSIKENASWLSYGIHSYILIKEEKSINCGIINDKDTDIILVNSLTAVIFTQCFSIETKFLVTQLEIVRVCLFDCIIVTIYIWATRYKLFHFIN